MTLHCNICICITLPYCTATCRTLPYFTVLYRTLPYRTILYHAYQHDEKDRTNTYRQCKHTHICIYYTYNTYILYIQYHTIDVCSYLQTGEPGTELKCSSIVNRTGVKFAPRSSRAVQSKNVEKFSRVVPIA